MSYKLLNVSINNKPIGINTANQHHNEPNALCFL